MELERAKDYFRVGLIEDALVKAPDVINQQGWTIELRGNFGNADPILRASRGGTRTFKTLDAAANVVREIGLKQWRVITD